MEEKPDRSPPHSLRDSASETSQTMPELQQIEDCGPVEYRYLDYSIHIPELNNTPLEKSVTLDELPAYPDLRKYRNPQDWSSSRKLCLMWISVTGTGMTAFTAGMYAPCEEQFQQYWNISRVKATVGITIFTCGFAIAPMILAPFSELAGRRPVFVITGLLFLVFQICCGVTRLFAGMLIGRFLAGCAASTFSTMVGGVVADVYRGEERNAPMAMFTGAAMIGTGLGPMMAGFVNEHTTWRWIFYAHSIFVAMVMAIVVFFFNETRGSVLLSRMAATLNAHYDAREAAGFHGLVETDGGKTRRLRWKVKADEERGSLLQMIRISVARPLHMLVSEPVVFFFSLFVSFSWAVLYMLFSSIPYVFRTVYNFSIQEQNAVFAAVSISGFITTIVSIWQERFAQRRGILKPGPEQRLFFCCFESLAMPIGLFWFGWTAMPDIHWVVPAIAIGIATIGIFHIYLATFNYLADGYGPFASSAIAAQSFCRNMLGGTFPLFTQQMYQRLGIGGASSLLGGLGLVLTLVPWVLAFYGPRIRAQSKICSQLMKTS